MTDVSYLKAHRVKRLTKRQRERMDELIERYAVDRGGKPNMGRVNHNFRADDGPDGMPDIESATDIDIEMAVTTANIVTAASEFRACGFVVATSGDTNIFDQ